MEKSQHEAVHDILAQQQHLKQARDKISHMFGKSIYIISGDYAIREEIKGHFETLGFPHKNLHVSNTPIKATNAIKKDPSDVDLVICHMNVLDSRTSTQTGIQLLKIVKEILLRSGSHITIPFVFMEQSYEKHQIVNALKSGVSQLIVIPTTTVSLGNKIADAIKKTDGGAASPTPSKITDLLLEANKKRDMGNFSEAIKIYNQALKLSDNNLEILTEKGNALLEMGNIDEAIEIFRLVVEIQKNYPRAYQGLGTAYEQLGDFTEARKNYLKVLELEPDNVQVHYNVGVIHQKEGNYEDAQSCFNKGIELNDKFVKNYLGLASNYEAQENPKAALNVYKQAMLANPNQPSLYLTAGDFCLKHSFYEEAEGLFSSALSANEKHIHLYNRMGIALRKQKKFKEAIENYARAIKIKPDDAVLYYNQAKACFLNREEVTSIELVKKAFELDPELIAKFKEDGAFSKLMKAYPDKFSF